jgi:hypothetical protein
MCMFARGIDIAPFCDFPIEFWKCSDSVVFIIIHFIDYIKEVK